MRADCCASLVRTTPTRRKVARSGGKAAASGLGQYVICESRRMTVRSRERSRSGCETFGRDGDDTCRHQNTSYAGRQEASRQTSPRRASAECDQGSWRMTVRQRRRRRVRRAERQRPIAAGPACVVVQPPARQTWTADWAEPHRQRQRTQLDPRRAVVEPPARQTRTADRAEPRLGRHLERRLAVEEGVYASEAASGRTPAL